jgi:hypothetical protein
MCYRPEFRINLDPGCDVCSTLSVLNLRLDSPYQTKLFLRSAFYIRHRPRGNYINSFWHKLVSGDQDRDYNMFAARSVKLNLMATSGPAPDLAESAMNNSYYMHGSRSHVAIMAVLTL